MNYVPHYKFLRHQKFILLYLYLYFYACRRPYGIEKEFFIQLFLEMDESMLLPSVGDLLNKMFREQQISFTEVYMFMHTSSSTRCMEG